MSEQNTIPQNNLPIYLQEYTISVLGNVTSLECPSEPGVGGCVGTQYGCCPDGVTASNADGSNCPGEVGTIQYSTLGVIPSNKKDARVWDFTPKKIHSDTLLCVLYDSFIGSITIRFKIKNF